MNRVNVFWTAGLDSTCRIVELSSTPGYEIQPYYIFDKSRRSGSIELGRIREMSALIRSNPATKSVLNDVIVVNIGDIVIPKEISDTYRIIRRRYSLGSQYEWISAFLNNEGIVVQMAAESPRVGINAAISGECRLRAEGDGEMDKVLRIDPAESTEEGRLLFSNYALPYHIWTIYKQDEAEEIKALGYEDVFKLTWFCHRPVFGMPCGHCNPCKDAKRDGFGWRIPLAGRLLYPFARLFRHAFRH